MPAGGGSSQRGVDRGVGSSGRSEVDCFFGRSRRSLALACVFRAGTGTPFTVFSNYRQRADQNGDPNNGPKTTAKWFNTSVFTPAKGAQGTAPRNSVRGPGTRALDLSIFKTFALPRYGALELRVEGFNIFNWAQYSQPHQYTGDSQFGAITGTRLNSERQVQLAARYIY